MASDLSVDRNGDLELTISRDLAVVTGSAQIAQRIFLRLSGLFPIRNELGLGNEVLDVGSGAATYLRRVLNEQSMIEISTRVNDALVDMSDIVIGDVLVDPSPDESGRVRLQVSYFMAPINEDDEGSEEAQILEVRI